MRNLKYAISIFSALAVIAFNANAQLALNNFGGGLTLQINNALVVHADGDVNNLSSATLVMGSTGEPNLEFEGNFDNATDATFTAGTGLLELTGSGNQNLDFGGDDLYNLEINNSSGGTFTYPATINNEVQFNTGDFTSDATNFLTFETSASHAGAADGSHMNGPVAKNFNSTSNFSFPTGDGTSLNTIGYEPDGTGATTMKATYFFTTPSSRDNKEAALIKTSYLEQWTMSRESGSENGDVTLEWDADSDVGTHTDLVVAGWDGSQWVSRGAAVHTGNATSGTVKSTSVSSFTTFTLGSINTTNTLPVELVDFTAKANGEDQVVLKWSTASEINNDYFAIERSEDGENYYPIDSVNSYGDGNSIELQHYGYVDNEPLTGTSYYRLRQVDYDDDYEYSSAQIVNFNGLEVASLFPNPSNGEINLVINSSQQETIQVAIYDAIGQMVQSDLVKIEEGSTQLTNFIHGAKGKYFVSVTTSNGEHYGYYMMVVK